MEAKRLTAIFLFVLMSCLSTPSWAMPGHVEMWFLKEPKAGALIQWLNLQYAFAVKTGPLTAQVDEEKCIPTEGGCFHPQYGLIEGGGKEKEKAPVFEEPKRPGIPDFEQEDERGEASPSSGKLKTINSDQTEKIDCDKGQFFDLYCGKARREAARSTAGAKLEIWVDISSSFKGIDYSADDLNCHRRKFVSLAQQWCGGKILMSTYNTSIKEVMSDDAFCLSYGLNDTDRLIDWIKSNTSKNLVIITDVSEISNKLSVFLASIGAVTEGLDATDFYAKDLLNKEMHIKTLCR
ncbi:MAG: hypothetical protein A2X86_10000 [Bdellovibrionales bacterium GWA2_49_15]|nr:MAG: hypothetical protein A2X86_10000 [Bdellovibrionales bacterium GWA2_49_15]HAZ13116.1 hypothetical protein [Bdellovibrionales bacterium]